jgi:hypothetical protein
MIFAITIRTANMWDIQEESEVTRWWIIKNPAAGHLSFGIDSTSHCYSVVMEDKVNETYYRLTESRVTA